ncbi:hypothetical protein [Paracoccus salsus]|uniref:hypothetical protein n=1 Tax=Paracoccus salsus TaxID=2911061 RepID=UPI001F46C321|nr:hypothetical protein [Paracoccus salsus]MCF3973988.1 hypothetical protein [Paracoccus salsus]
MNLETCALRLPGHHLEFRLDERHGRLAAGGGDLAGTDNTDKGLPRYLDAIESDQSALADAEDLLPVCMRDLPVKHAMQGTLGGTARFGGVTTVRLMRL